MIRSRFRLALVAAASLALTACGATSTRPATAGASAPPGSSTAASTTGRAVEIVAAAAPTIERIIVRYQAARVVAAPVVAMMAPERAALITAIADRVDRALVLAARASTIAQRRAELKRAEAAIVEFETKGTGVATTPALLDASPAVAEP